MTVTSRAIVAAANRLGRDAAPDQAAWPQRRPVSRERSRATNRATKPATVSRERSRAAWDGL